MSAIPFYNLWLNIAACISHHSCLEDAVYVNIITHLACMEISPICSLPTAMNCLSSGWKKGDCKTYRETRLLSK